MNSAFATFIKAGLDGGLSAQRIYQDLVSEQKIGGGYDAVKRFVRQLQSAHPLPFRRLESEPGQEAQVDFGQGAWVAEDGHRRPHVLRVVLSHSRKGYTEAFWRQTTENFVRGLENALRHFGGVRMGGDGKKGRPASIHAKLKKWLNFVSVHLRKR